ncbi:MAG TPA: YmdB family metallophosphoesterase, partial [Dehalococcoidia bacterium]
MKILAIGDIIGKPGRNAVKKILPGLRSEYNIALVIGNGENAAGGLGLT